MLSNKVSLDITKDTGYPGNKRVNPEGLPLLNSTREKTMRTDFRKETAHYRAEWERGMTDEEKVMEFLSSKGFKITKSELLEDMVSDIDFYVGSPKYSVSFKSQLKGLKFGHIYFELHTQRYNGHALVDLEDEHGRAIGKWYPSWFYTGKPKYYLILQGNKLDLYYKEQIEEYVAKNGWLHVKGLSPTVLAGQRGKDTRCGYLSNKAIRPLSTWYL